MWYPIRELKIGRQVFFFLIQYINWSINHLCDTISVYDRSRARVCMSHGSPCRVATPFRFISLCRNLLRRQWYVG